jgi:hypothetical protein
MLPFTEDDCNYYTNWRNHTGRFGDYLKELSSVVGANRERVADEEDPSEFLRLLYGELAVRLVAIPAPLNPTSFSYGPRVESTAYAIVGPPNVKKESSATSTGLIPTAYGLTSSSSGRLLPSTNGSLAGKARL